MLSIQLPQPREKVVAHDGLLPRAIDVRCWTTPLAKDGKPGIVAITRKGDTVLNGVDVNWKNSLVWCGSNTSLIDDSVALTVIITNLLDGTLVVPCDTRWNWRVVGEKDRTPRGGCVTILGGECNARDTSEGCELDKRSELNHWI